MSEVEEPIQHPIGKLGFFIEYTNSWLVEVNDGVTLLEKVRGKPLVLTDDDVQRAREGYVQAGEDLVLFEDTATRWAPQTSLTREQRTGLDVLTANLARLRTLNTSALELLAYIRPRTIDRVVATPDMELGLNALINYVSGENNKDVP